MTQSEVPVPIQDSGGKGRKPKLKLLLLMNLDRKSFTRPFSGSRGFLALIFDSDTDNFTFAEYVDTNSAENAVSSGSTQIPSRHGFRIYWKPHQRLPPVRIDPLLLFQLLLLLLRLLLLSLSSPSPF